MRKNFHRKTPPCIKVENKQYRWLYTFSIWDNIETGGGKQRWFGGNFMIFFKFFLCILKGGKFDFSRKSQFCLRKKLWILDFFLENFFFSAEFGVYTREKWRENAKIRRSWFLKIFAKSRFFGRLPYCKSKQTCSDHNSARSTIQMPSFWTISTLELEQRMHYLLMWKAVKKSRNGQWRKR